MNRPIFNRMVEYTSTQLDHLFRALADPTRREMLGQLTHGEQTVGQLAEPHAMSFAAAAKHVRKLEEAGLITREIRGRHHVCHLAPAPLAHAHDWLGFYARFWDDRLAVLERLLQDDARQHPDRSHGDPP